MINFLVYLLVLMIVGGIIYWLISMMPIPQPFKNIILVVLGLILVIILLNSVGFLGEPYPLWIGPHR